MSRKPWPVVSSVQSVQAFYEKCRNEGTSHSLAEIFATRSTPSLKTDTNFMSGGEQGGMQFDGKGVTADIGRQYVRQARRAGVSDVGSRKYYSQIARFPGDPRAWCDSKGDLKRKIQEDGDGCEELGVKAVDRVGVDKAPVSKLDINKRRSG